MKEDFLHYIWRTKQFDHKSLKTTAGEPVQILKHGSWNKHAGPDFLNAKLIINKTEWVGHVEIHVKENDWFLHNHHTNKAFDNTVLHVCYTANKPAKRTDGSIIPCIELQNNIHPDTEKAYSNLIQSTGSIPCAGQMHKVKEHTRNLWLNALLIERLEEKASITEELLNESNKDWTAIYIKKLFRSFGLKINAAPFEMLAKNLPYSILKKHLHNLLQIEALLFGVAGFLEEDPKDEYQASLKKEFIFLAAKYNLEIIPVHLWKFMRLRPANFPSVRLAQLAMLLHSEANLLSNTISVSNMKEAYLVYRKTAGIYWNTHYTFGKVSTHRPKRIGQKLVDLIFINAAIPVLFAYAKHQGRMDDAEKHIRLFDLIPAEKNKIVQIYLDFGWDINSAALSQACLQLNKKYCNFIKCLQCAIGHTLIKQ